MFVYIRARTAAGNLAKLWPPLRPWRAGNIVPRSRRGQDHFFPIFGQFSLLLPHELHIKILAEIYRSTSRTITVRWLRADADKCSKLLILPSISQFTPVLREMIYAEKCLDTFLLIILKRHISDQNGTYKDQRGRCVVC